MTRSPRSSDRPPPNNSAVAAIAAKLLMQRGSETPTRDGTATRSGSTKSWEAANKPNRDAAPRPTMRLKEFVRAAWVVLNPNTPYYHGRHIDAICDLLEAITYSNR